MSTSAYQWAKPHALFGLKVIAAQPVQPIARPILQPGIGGSFNPAIFFASGEQGGWYDPSDFSTMFQDAAGTTPVTAVEQPVGLILDKSKGLVLGPELIAQPVNFNANWEATPGGTPVASGSSFTTSSIGGFWINALTPGKTYQVTVNGSTTAASGVTLRQTNTTTTSQIMVGFGSAVFTAQSGFTYFYVRNESAGTTTVTSISVRELPGNHATQTTSTSRPVLSARYNLLTKTEQFDDAVWTKGDATISANTAITTDPLGGSTADILVENSSSSVAHFVSQNISTTSGQSVTFSVYAKAAGRNWLRLAGQTSGFSAPNHAWFDLENGVLGTVESGTTASIASLGNGWYRCSWTRSAALTNATVAMFICSQTANNELVYTGTGINSIYIWGASLVPANQATLPYQRVNTATDYDADPSKFKPYLRFDGIDDWLVTPTITPGTDKAQVFAGVRKLSDAAAFMRIVEYGDVVAANGSLSVNAPAANGAATYEVALRGTQTTAFNLSTFAAPITSVLSSAFDIGQTTRETEILPRVNASTPTLVGTGSANAGTGNFGNHAFYIGRRGGTTLPFNGHLYGLIVRFGANLPAGTIASTETWLNQRTGAY